MGAPSVEFYDVVIIGAGPIGGYLGWKLRKQGHSVLIVEEHSEIGRPFQCAGLRPDSPMCSGCDGYG